MKRVAIGIGLLCICLLLISRFHVPSGLLEISFMYVGQGDGIYIRFPDGRDMIIDASPDNTILHVLPEVMPWTDRHINYLMVSHADFDHYAGFLGLYEQYSVGELWYSGTDKFDPLFEVLKENALRTGTLRKVQRGNIIRFDDDMYFEALWPHEPFAEEENERSIMGRLVYKNISIMFTGDAGIESEQSIYAAQSELKSTVLKVGHHGSKNSSDSAFLAAIDADICIISAGIDNSYNHPHEETVARLEASGCAILSTQTEGTIQLISDGKTITRGR